MEDTGLFVIDLSGCTNTGEIINSLSVALEIPNTQGKGICLKIKDNVLNQSQILSIKSLIESYGSSLMHVETASLITQNVCESMGIKVIQTQVHQITAVEPHIESQSGSLIRPLAEDMEANRNIKENQNIENEFSTIKKINEEPGLKLEVPELKAEPEYTCHKEDPVTFIENNKENIELTNIEPVNYSAPIVPAPHILRNEEFQKLKDEIAKDNNDVVEEVEESKMTLLDTIVDPIINPAENERQVIGVYKKAVEEENTNDCEEVDFYAPPTDEAVVVDSKKTIYVNQTLRSGQTLEFDGNIIIIGDCHPGSEVKATGDITVWGVLGSIAHAGATGNRDAKIRALKMNAVQLRIANCYSRRPDTTNIPYIVKSSVFTPEEARIIDDGIVLFKLG